MRSIRRFVPEILLISVACALVARHLVGAPENLQTHVRPRDPGLFMPDSPKAISEWSIDRVSPGMTYEQVISILGPPSQLKTERDEWIRLRWGSHNTVFFQRGIAFACFGSRLYRGSAQVAAHPEDVATLKKVLGKGRESDWVTQWWWADIQVGSTYHNQFVQVAPSIGEPKLDNKVSWKCPWGSDWSDRIALDGVTLGERRRGAGESPPAVELSRSGYVVAVSGRTLSYDANLGHHIMNEGPFRIGDPVEKIGRWAPHGASMERFRSEDGHVEVESSQGKITSLRLVLDEPELIQVLDRKVLH